MSTFPSAAEPRTLSVAVLEDRVPRLLMGGGMTPADALVVSRVLLDTSLRGVESHGIEKLPMYMDAFERRTLEPAPELIVEDPGGPTATIDAGRGLGFVPSVRAADLAVDKAAHFGVGAVAVRGSGHFGAGGYYVRAIAEAGRVGFISTNARPLLPRPGGTTPLVGNNPFAFGAPRSQGPPFVIDMACSVSAFGKVRDARASGEEVPEEWGYDHTGSPTRDPAAILEGGFLAPFGGYKGFNLAMMMELLSAALCGAAIGPRAGSVGELDVDGCGHFVLALDPTHFGGEGMERVVDGWLEWMRASEPRLRVPGETGARLRDQRLDDGIAVSDSLAALLDSVATPATSSPTSDKQV